MTLTLGHVCFVVVYVQFLESFDVRSKRTAYAKLVSKLVRNSAKTLLMYTLAPLLANPPHYTCGVSGCNFSRVRCAECKSIYDYREIGLKLLTPAVACTIHELGTIQRSIYQGL
jgi:hypothetical protein